MRRGVRRLRNLLRWRRVDEELTAEVAHHLAAAEAQYRWLGMSEQAARQAALRDFGGERWLEASRDARGVSWLQDVFRDARYGLRSMGRAPGFAAAVVLVIGLGIGATTAVFSVVRGVLLNPLPYRDADALHNLLEGDSAGGQRLLSYPTFRDLEAEAGAVAELAYVRGESVLMRTDEGSLNLLGAFVTPQFFSVLDRAPQAGRVFSATEQDQPVAVLSWRMAQRLYGDARGALEREISTRDGRYTVIGVMPPGFSYPAWADLWLPIGALPPETRFALTQRNLHVDSDVVLRLKPDVTADEAAAALGGHIARLDALHREPEGKYDRAVVRPLAERVVGTIAPRYVVLLSSVILVLIIACVNVAGLLLARGMSRRSELTARLALGASRTRLIRQLLMESVLLAVAGGALGVLLAWSALRSLHAAGPRVLPRLEEITLDGGVLLFALGASLLSALFFGALPALRATSGIADGALRGSARGATGDGAAVRLRGALVVAQIALAVVLLVGASLLVRTARELGRQDLGFDADNLLTLRVIPPDEYGDDAARLLLYERLRESVRSVPGVVDVALVNHVPLAFAAMPTAVRTARRLEDTDRALAIYRTVSVDYLPMIGARLSAGAMLDEVSARNGVMVNRALARREWGEENPVGREITVFRVAQGAAGFGEPLPSQVVGVIEDIREFGPDEDAPPVVYVPLERNVWPNVHLMVRTAGSPHVLIPRLRAAVRDVSADVPVAGPSYINEFTPLTHYLGQVTGTRRFATAVLAVFAATAVLLSLVGLFAVMTYVVAQRSREIGLRMALGARPRDAAALVMRQTALLVILGLTLGIAAAVPATRLLEGLLFGVPPLDPVAFAATAGLFLLTALVAAWLPARRAAGVDPMHALRLE